MSSVTCPNCNHANPPGSKFCSDCGNRLPASNIIICPSCQTPNAASLFYCDNCGARLVKATLPTEIESDPDLEEEADQSSFRPADLFALPTRKPGDTGKLDPSTVPDWLRTGQKEGDTPPPIPDSADVDSFLYDSDLLDDLDPKQGSTDELPDWLVTDSSADIFQPPSEISTEAYLAMMDDVPLEIEGKTGITDELNLPNWLTDAVKETGSLTDSKVPASKSDESDELPDIFQTTTNIPDWLAEIGDGPTNEDQTAKTTEAVPAVEDWGFSESDFDESPDWLLDSDSTDTTVSEATEKTPLVEDRGSSESAFDESPDWLLDSADEEVAEPELIEEVPTVEDWGQAELDESPDWLADNATPETPMLELPHEAIDWGDWGTAVAPKASPPEWYSELARPETDVYESWLAEVNDLEEPMFVIDEPEVASVADRLNDWLLDEEDTGVYEETAVYDDASEDEPEDEEGKVVTGMLTGWLTDLEETDDDEFADEAFLDEAEKEKKVVTGMLTGWLTELDESEGEGDDEGLDTGQFTTWLTGTDEVSEDNSIDKDSGDAEPIADMFTSWLTNEGEEEGVSVLDSASTEKEPEPGMFTDWLSGGAELDASDSGASEEEPEPGMFTNWLSSDDETNDDEGVSELELESGVFTGWLSGTDEFEGDELAEETSGFTGWLSDADETNETNGDSQFEEELETGQFTGWLSDADEINEAGLLEDEPATELGSGIFTGWLTDTDNLNETSLDSENPETGEFTDWLAATQTSRQSSLPEDTTSEEEPESGMLTSWLTGPDDEGDDDLVGDDADAGQKVVTGMLTGWLAELDETNEDEEANEASTFSDWLSTVEEPEESPKNEAILDTPDSLPEWLVKMKEDGTEAPAAPVAESKEELPDWMPGVVDEQKADESAMDALPDWFDDLQQVEAAQADNYDEIGDFAGDLFAEDDASSLDLDWMESGTGDLLGEEEAVEATADYSADDSLIDGDAAALDIHDWMSELDALETEDFTTTPEMSEFDRRFADIVAYPESQTKDAPQIQADEEPEFDDEAMSELPSPATFDTDDMLDELPLSEEEAAEAFPDWLSDLGDSSKEQTEHQSELIQEDLPNWLSNMKPSTVDSHASSLPGLGLDANLADDFGYIPEELSGADLPDWLQGIPTSSQQDDGEAGQYGPDASDWLQSEQDLSIEQDSSSQLRSILNELPPPRDPKEDLVKAEIPEWIDALKPKDLTKDSQTTIVAGASPKSGPLSGVQGAIEIAPIIAVSHIAQSVQINQLTVTPEQAQQVALLQKLAQSELMVSETTAVSPRRRFPWGRILLSLVLIAVMSTAILLGDKLSLVRDGQANAPGSVVAMEAVLAAAGDAPVLVVFDYTPALGAELDVQAEAVMSQLIDNGNQVIAVSEYAAGTAVAASHNNESAMFIPGEAIGLRQLGGCLAATCEMLYGRSLDIELDQVSLIIVLTGERRNLINWIEQVGAQTELPILAGTTEALEPLALSYMNSGQLAGTLTYQTAVGHYKGTLPISAGGTTDNQATNARVLVQLLVVVILLVSLLWQIIRSSRQR